MSHNLPKPSINKNSLIEQQLLESYAKQFGNSLKRYFQRRGAQKATAEDLTQTVFLRLVKRVEGNQLEKPQAYLMQAAASVWRDHLNQRRIHHYKEHVEFDENFEDLPEAFSPKRVLEGRETVKIIADLLNSLPERTKLIYLLCRIEGLKRKEVAECLSITVSAVDKHLITATTRIKDHFS
jgi:RNA polymerase sigma-70 factor (ECF subfamily)